MNEEALKAKVKEFLVSCFPGAAWREAEPNKLVGLDSYDDLGIEYVHVVRVMDGGTPEKAADGLIGELRMFKYFKQPKVIFFRSCRFYKVVDFDIDTEAVRASVRFSLGYGKGDAK